MKQPSIRIQPGLILIYGQTIDAKPHQHHAIQLIWPDQKCTLTVDKQQINQACLIAPDTLHQLEMLSGWILLIEPQSSLGVCLLKKLQSSPTLLLSDDAFSNAEVKQHKENSWNIDNLPKMLKNLLEATTSQPQLDPRIEKLLQTFNQCLENECIKPDHWRACDVASAMNLSESRFLHLFRQQMNLPWRPYLLWRRLLCALIKLQNGHSATQAAIHSGFSDSAHLSRTFKNNFGLTIREASKLFETRK